MASKRFCPFRAAGHACFSIGSRGRLSILHCGPSHQGDPSHLSPSFMLYAQNHSLYPNKKELYRPEEIGPKLEVLLHSQLCPFSLQKAQICDSHINFHRKRKHFAGSRWQDTLLKEEKCIFLNDCYIINGQL